MQVISQSEAKHFLILFRDGGLQYRGIYTYSPEREEVFKIQGVGPKQLNNKTIERFYKWVFLFFSVVQLRCQVRVLYHPPPSSPVVMDISILQMVLVHIMPDVIQPSHSCSSFCRSNSHFHLHHLLHLIFFIRPQNVSIPAQPSLPCFQCDISTPKSLLFSLCRSGQLLFIFRLTFIVTDLTLWTPQTKANMC